MTEQKKVIISISKDSLRIIKKLGLSPEDVFSKGLHEMLRKKYQQFSLLDDEDDEDELLVTDLSDLTESLSKIDKIMINEQDVTNN
ncbi:MAG: hypothetical protein KGY65_00750 [Candidatus Thermoplasmatota archaeon]|nr:hypothetical protein [Candidatus Thermoplasmatota archaeon]